MVFTPTVLYTVTEYNNIGYRVKKIASWASFFSLFSLVVLVHCGSLSSIVDHPIGDFNVIATLWITNYFKWKCLHFERCTDSVHYFPNARDSAAPFIGWVVKSRSDFRNISYYV